MFFDGQNSLRPVIQRNMLDKQESSDALTKTKRIANSREKSDKEEQRKIMDRSEQMNKSKIFYNNMPLFWSRVYIKSSNQLH